MPQSVPLYVGEDTLACLQLPTLRSTLILSEPRKEFTDRDPLVNVGLTLENQTALRVILLHEVFRSPLGLEFGKETCDDDGFSLHPERAKNVLSQPRICDGHCRV